MRFRRRSSNDESAAAELGAIGAIGAIGAMGAGARREQRNNEPAAAGLGAIGALSADARTEPRDGETVGLLSASARENLENMPMTIHRMEQNFGFGGGAGCGKRISRQLQTIIDCLGCNAEEEDESATALEAMDTAQRRAIASSITGAANPAAGIAPAEWVCPLSGQTCPFSSCINNTQTAE